ncbi:MAG: hypothetical protein DRO99_01485 [Candidatus Aenigmatarchaeota archaeon]|nr:MAG: hypothetical protein DRO99_01485 [Candidatus Aenigmarchaeota archaeon]
MIAVGILLTSLRQYIIMMPRREAVLATVPALVALSVLISTALASPGIELRIEDSQGNYTVNEGIRGSILLIYDEYIPPTAVLYSYVDGQFASQVSLSDKLHESSYYTFVTRPFSYDVVASGLNTWTEYPEQAFDYSIDVSGTCGDPDVCCNVTANPPTCWCDCKRTGGDAYCGDNSNPSSYPCDWQITQRIPFASDTVKGSEGLKFIQDFSFADIPADSNNDEVWAEIANTNPEVRTTMREACGSQMYMGHAVLQDGWVHQRQLNPGSWLTSGFDKYTNIEPFDHRSLIGEGRRMFADSNIGGIYKDDVYQVYNDGAVWNGTTGYIRIFNYDPSSVYYITYMPPNGPKLCAYTDVRNEGQEAWSANNSYNGACSFSEPYTRQFSEYQLPQPPDCPPDTEECEKSVNDYVVVKTYDPSGSVSVLYNQDTMTVTGTTSSRQLTNSYSDTINLNSFSGLKSDQKGNHVLRIELWSGGSVIASNSSVFRVCNDSDRDGYCGIGDGGQDCDDFDPDRNPGEAEKCNGIDDDCDGVIDNGFFMFGKQMGSPCGGAPNTACQGVWVCTQDGTNATCFREHGPGELFEVCDNNIDDDCDGEIDEIMTLEGGPACWCKIGETRACGSNIGACKSGVMTCVMGGDGKPAWSKCISGTMPAEEVCNNEDDDCDGEIDNVGGGNSRESTACGCYGDGMPMPEECNEIDDDCDGKIDEGMNCCTDGETRPCGSDVGACSKGVQTCIAGSWHRSECEGGVTAKAEICYNNEDDDCDGLVDEGCEVNYTCQNGIQDLNEDGIDCGGPCPNQCSTGPLWMIIAGVMILVMLGIWSFVMKQSGD